MTARQGGPLTSKDVVTHARVTYRQLDHWTRKGWLEPAGAGSGHVREWSLTEFAIAVRMGALVEMGYRPRTAAQIAHAGIERDR